MVSACFSRTITYREGLFQGFTCLALTSTSPLPEDGSCPCFKLEKSVWTKWFTVAELFLIVLITLINIKVLKVNPQYSRKKSENLSLRCISHIVNVPPLPCILLLTKKKSEQDIFYMYMRSIILWRCWHVHSDVMTLTPYLNMEISFFKKLLQIKKILMKIQRYCLWCKKNEIFSDENSCSVMNVKTT